MLAVHIFFPAPGSIFARAKILYRKLVDDVVEIFGLLHTRGGGGGPTLF